MAHCLGSDSMDARLPGLGSPGVEGLCWRY